MSNRESRSPEGEQSPTKPPDKDRWWPWFLLELAGMLAPIAVLAALAGAVFVGTWRALRRSRVGTALALFTASVLGVAILGLVLAMLVKR